MAGVPQRDGLVQRWSEVGELLGYRFTRIDGQLGELKSDVAELKSDMVVVKADVAELKSDMVVVKADVAELKSDMVVVKADIAELKSDVGELKGQVARLEESTRLGFQRIDANFEELRYLIARDERRNPPPGAGKAPRPRKQ